MLNKNKIKKVLYIDHNRSEIDLIRIKKEYEGHIIEVYSVGHALWAKEIFKKKNLDIILEDSTDSISSKLSIEKLKKYCNFKGIHLYIQLNKKNHIEQIKGNNITEPEKQFLDGLVYSIIQKFRGASKKIYTEETKSI